MASIHASEQEDPRLGTELHNRTKPHVVGSRALSSGARFNEHSKFGAEGATKKSIVDVRAMHS